MKSAGLVLLVFVVLHALLDASQAKSAYQIVDVAFFEEFDEAGNRLELVKGGRYFHVAIRAGDFWYEASPVHGVRRVKDIRFIGRPHEVLSGISDAADIVNFLESELGKTYDFQFEWRRADSSYCSKLAAQALGIPPQPMEFSGRYWRKHPTELPEGRPGISPDRLYNQLLAKGFKKVLIPDQDLFLRSEQSCWLAMLGRRL